MVEVREHTLTGIKNSVNIGCKHYSILHKLFLLNVSILYAYNLNGGGSGVPAHAVGRQDLHRNEEGYPYSVFLEGPNGLIRGF
jgi:hypothetical protein